jgi:hypothetical protein
VTLPIHLHSHLRVPVPVPVFCCRSSFLDLISCILCCHHHPPSTMPPKKVPRRHAIGRNGKSKKCRKPNEQSNNQSANVDDLYADNDASQSEGDELQSNEEVMKIMKIRRQEQVIVTQTTAMRNHAIAYHYLKILKAPIGVWDGKGGVVAEIVKHLGIPKGSGSLVTNVLLDVEYALTMGEPYDGNVDRSGVGRPALVPKDSYELQIIADAIEGGQRMSGATILVNEHRKEDGKEPLGCSAVYNASLSLRPKVVTIKSMSQGEGRDEGSNYRKARYNYIRHLLVRFGIDLVHPEDAPDPLLDWLNSDKLTEGKHLLVISQIAWWDETHQKCKIGGSGAGDDARRRWKTRRQWYLRFFQKEIKGQVGAGRLLWPWRHCHSGSISSGRNRASCWCSTSVI